MSLNVEDLFNNPITKYDNEKIDTIAYGLRNPWSCFLNKKDLIVPDVETHWEEINVIKDYELISNPIFLDAMA